MARPIRIEAPSFWPGLARIRPGREISDILPGMFFAAALNVAVVGRWIQLEALPSGWADFFATLAGVTWLAILSYTILWVRIFCHPDRHRLEIDRLFPEVHEADLQGHRDESRRRIERILAMDESDSDALLQLGTLYVRTHQPTSACRAFRQCLESKHGAKWRWEIQHALARWGDG